VNDDEEGQATAIRLQRLGVPIAKEAVPTYHDLGLASLVDEATEWQVLRAGAWFWGWAAMVGLDEPERWVEIGTLFGSVGESVCLAAAAEIEVEILRRAIAGSVVRRYYGISQRWYAEAEGQTILSVGHRLANIVARALMGDALYPWDQVLRRLETRFPASSTNKRHWISLAHANDLRRIADASPYASLKLMANGLDTLARSAAWKALEEQRGVDFHRSRSESPFVTKPAFAVEPGQKSISMLGAPAADDASSKEFVEAICRAPREALQPLLAAMTSIREGWMRAMEEFSKGTFTREGDHFRIEPSTKK
jgi:hypothetical protein